MVNAANMLLDAPAASQQASGIGAGQAPNSQDPSDSPFLAMVQELMGSEEQATTDAGRAGQQVDEGAQPSDGDQPQSEDAMAQMSYLLGSVQTACSEVQALPTEVVTNTSATADVLPATAEGSAPAAAPITASPISAEVSSDITEAESAQAAEAAQAIPEAAGETSTPGPETRPTGRSAQVRADQPVETEQGTQTAVARTESQSSESNAQPVRDERPSGRTTAREQSERTEVPEYLRNIVSQQTHQPTDRVVIGRQAPSIQSVADADPELAATPVDQPSQGDTGTPLPDFDQSVRWMPIEARPVADTAVPTAAVRPQAQPIDQVERTNIIHQIVRTAKVSVFEGGGEMVMRLEPAHLGSIQMSVTADQGIVTANLKAGTESVRQALEAGIPGLRQSLADAGIHVDAISVSVGDGQGQGWNLHAGMHNGSQQMANQQNGYAGIARSFRGEGDAVSIDQSSTPQTSAGFNYLA